MHNPSHGLPPPPLGSAPAEQRSSHDPQRPLPTRPPSTCSFVFLMSNRKTGRMKAISQSRSRHWSAEVHSTDMLLGAAKAQQRPREGSPAIPREAQGPPSQSLERGHIVPWSRSLPVCPSVSLIPATFPVFRLWLVEGDGFTEAWTVPCAIIRAARGQGAAVQVYGVSLWCSVVLVPHRVAFLGCSL